ncbi:MAG: transcriptional regulator LldR [Corticimicrobacter sp.]|uniref:transcriptional regulator LldR n=1 Tax=Corticimicrobacter sp. TaxID=2678536 RepID=UPI0032DB850E
MDDSRTPVKTTRLADRVAHELTLMIQTRNLQAGDRLPAERQLAKELDVSRTCLREAIQKLSSQGLLVSRPGGGTYVQATAHDQHDGSIMHPLLPLLESDPEYRYDVLEIRHALESTAISHAALRATDADKARIRAKFDAMMARHGTDAPMEEARADASFHIAIAEASHNLVLILVMRSLFDLLQASVSQNLGKLYTRPNVYETLTQQHLALVEAIEAGDPDRARTAMRTHIDFVYSTLKTIDEDEARQARSARLAAKPQGTTTSRSARKRQPS